MRILLLAVCVWSCQADTELRNCPRPTLRGGFLFPQQESYDHGAKVFYSCELALKPAVETWWGEILCGDGAWSHTPHCVDKTDCIAPVVPHATLEPPRVSYSTNSKVSFRCDKGYRLNEADFREAVCENGEWNRLPSCVRQVNACDPPSHVPNTIITQPYQDTFENGDTIQYLCKEGYIGHGTSRCEESEWKPALKCVHRPDQTGDSATLPVASCEPYPTIKNGDIIEIKEGWALKVECALYFKREGPEEVKCVDGRWSEVPQCTEFLQRPPSHVILCGRTPNIKNGDVTVAADYKSLTVQCSERYTRVGPEFVLCVKNEWTELPACKAPCEVDQSRFAFQQPEYFLHGFEKWFYCKGSIRTGDVKCEDGRMYYKGCDSATLPGDSATLPGDSATLPVTLCGRTPIIKNGDVTVAADHMSLTVQCSDRYTRVGPEFVLCVINEWTELPTCKAPCEVDQSRFAFQQPEYFVHGYEKWFYCKGSIRTGNVKCEDGRLSFKGCGYSDW